LLISLWESGFGVYLRGFPSHNSSTFQLNFCTFTGYDQMISNAGIPLIGPVDFNGDRRECP
jgi:hypothetical protein